jgi:hypothetical protein
LTFALQEGKGPIHPINGGIPVMVVQHSLWDLPTRHQVGIGKNESAALSFLAINANALLERELALAAIALSQVIRLLVRTPVRDLHLMDPGRAQILLAGTNEISTPLFLIASFSV